MEELNGKILCICKVFFARTAIKFFQERKKEQLFELFHMIFQGLLVSEQYWTSSVAHATHMQGQHV